MHWLTALLYFSLTAVSVTGSLLPEEEDELIEHFNKIIEETKKKWLNSNKAEYPFTDRQWDWFNSLHYYHPPGNNSGVTSGGHDVHNNKAGFTKKDETCDEIKTHYLTRKEWRRMSNLERNSYINSFNALSSYYPDPEDTNLSAYHLLIWMHRYEMAPGAHYGAPLLPWHREYMWRFGNALRQQGYVGDIPYFDSSIDQLLRNPADSALWTVQHIGLNTQGPLSEPFTDLRKIPECSDDGPEVLRGAPTLALTNKFLLFSQDRFDIIFNYTCFRDWTLLWVEEDTKNFEKFHDYGHIFVGGTMLEPLCSPHDPSFFLHHNFLDLLWEEFRKNYQQTNPEMEYPFTQIGLVPEYQEWNSPFLPFDGLRPDVNSDIDGTLMIEGMSNYYTNYYYTFETRPSAIVCETDTDCTGTNGSDLLWCETNTKTCRAKLRVTGSCDLDLPDKQCWCVQGSPVCDSQTETCQCS